MKTGDFLHWKVERGPGIELEVEQRILRHLPRRHVLSGRNYIAPRLHDGAVDLVDGVGLL